MSAAAATTDPRRPDAVRPPPGRPPRPDPDPAALAGLCCALAAMVWRHPACPWGAALGALSSASRWNSRTSDLTMTLYSIVFTAAAFAFTYYPPLAAMPLFGRTGGRAAAAV